MRAPLGIVYTIGYQLASVGKAFPFISAWLGWVGKAPNSGNVWSG